MEYSSPFSNPTIVKKPIPNVSNKNKDLLRIANFLRNMIVNTDVQIINNGVFNSTNQATGVAPINTSRSVPPPVEVINAMTTTPNISNFFRKPVRVPEIAKEIIPNISIQV